MAMLVCMAVVLFSCSKDDEVKYTEADVMGTWNITSAVPDVKVSDLEKINTDSLLAAGNILLQGSTLTFEDESELSVSIGQVITLVEGTWKLSGEKLYLSQEDEDDEIETEYIIQSMDKEKAVLLQPMASEGISFNYIYNLEKK